MRLTEIVHLKLRQALRPGDTVIDATAGNGHDTLALAELVGISGKVVAIDRQSAAIKTTRTRLEKSGQLAQCELIQRDHAEALSDLLADNQGRVAAITFNLGYLPGGEKQLTTRPESTLPGLDAAEQMIRPGGILLVTAYRGHPGGKDEAIQVENWMKALPINNWHIKAEEPPLRDPIRVPPILWIAERKTSSAAGNEEGRR
jgi:precorrin-6B methylase 2